MSEIKVTGCHDCPFAVNLEKFALCAKEKKQVSYYTIDVANTFPIFCPLLKESITISNKDSVASPGDGVTVVEGVKESELYLPSRGIIPDDHKPADPNQSEDDFWPMRYKDGDNPNPPLA